MVYLGVRMRVGMDRMMQDQVRASLAEFDQSYLRLRQYYIHLQRKRAIKHGSAIAIIIYINLQIWGIG